MNNSNQIIGDCATVTGVGQVFIHDLNSGTTTFISDPAWNYRGLALSNNGLALVERDPSLVPEPSSLIFLALGLVGIVGVTVRGYRSRFLGHVRGYLRIAPPPSIVDPDVTVRSRFIGHAAIATARAATGV